MITAVPQDNPDWPAREASPYADWWFKSDARAGLIDVVSNRARATAFTELSFEPLPLSQSSFRFRAVPDPQSKQPIARKMPIWKDALPPVSGLASGTMIRPVLDKEFGDPLAPAEPPRAVMVVIDTALNPVHEQFRRTGTSTRIVAHWLMEGRRGADDRVPFGREIRAAEIGAAACMGTEDAALRHLGVADFETPFGPRGAVHLLAHGTHVLALAAGTDPTDRTRGAKALRKVPILAVSLPSNRLLSTAGVFLDVFVDQALEWVSTRLSELYGQNWPPVVVNLSYGLAAGPKDGSGFLNARLRDWLDQHPTARLFMPAGNDGLARGHAVLTPGDGRGAICWIVPPGGAHSTFAEVWFSGAGPAELVLTPPDQDDAIRIVPAPEQVFDLQHAAGTTIGRVYVLPGATTDTLGCLICLAPTRPRDAAVQGASAGLWTIAVSGPAGLHAAVHVQSQRALNPSGLNARPSGLVALSATGAQPQQAGTLNAIGPGTGAFIVNGLNAAVDRHITEYGAMACTIRPLVPPQDAPLSNPLAHWTSRAGPSGPTHDAAALADRSRALPGQRAPGYRSGTTAVVEGTSFSTALAARAALERILQQAKPPPG